jgi:hypothetical protein
MMPKKTTQFFNSPKLHGIAKVALARIPAERGDRVGGQSDGLVAVVFAALAVEAFANELGMLASDEFYWDGRTLPDPSAVAKADAPSALGAGDVGRGRSPREGARELIARGQPSLTALGRLRRSRSFHVSGSCVANNELPCARVPSFALPFPVPLGSRGVAAMPGRWARFSAVPRPPSSCG